MNSLEFKQLVQRKYSKANRGFNKHFKATYTLRHQLMQYLDMLRRRDPSSEDLQVASRKLTTACEVANPIEIVTSLFDARFALVSYAQHGMNAVDPNVSGMILAINGLFSGDGLVSQGEYDAVVKPSRDLLYSHLDAAFAPDLLDADLLASALANASVATRLSFY